MTNINKILKLALAQIKPVKSEMDIFRNETKDIVNTLKCELKKKNIKAEVFVGGSLAKETIIRKEKYDIDIFVRFHEQDEKKLDEKFKKIMKGIKNKTKIHGSRDYYQIMPEKKGQNIYFEIVPVRYIKRPGMENNVTDLSFFHVSYIQKKIKKSKKLSDEIRLAKAFCFSQDCYGAESYIRGFSGYALELFVVYYGSFLKFIKEMSKSVISNKNKIVVDPAKHYKNEKEVLRDINKSKIEGPVIFIDPTFKERNALAALSSETLLKFKEACKDFLRKPSLYFFDKKYVSEEDLKKESKKKKAGLAKIRVKTNKQEGDIAGTKLHKFYRFILRGLNKNFEVVDSHFVYDDKKSADCYFMLKKKKEIILQGPPINAIANVKAFKKRHKHCFIKNHITYAREKPLTIKIFYSKFLKDNKRTIKDMGIISLNIL